jgi:hypothetical protein
MKLDERVALARLAYIRAVARARTSPTQASWARLLTAARNLEQATRARAAQAPPRSREGGRTADPR